MLLQAEKLFYVTMAALFCPLAAEINAGCLIISLKAFLSKLLPGSLRCQGDAPDGCGNAITSKEYPARLALNLWPMSLSSFCNGRNCAIASLPTGITSFGRKISCSCLSQAEQLSTSCGEGTRSPPVGFLPGKHRHTAAIYMEARNCSSLIPAAWLNQRKSVLPAVQANGRPSFGSLSPGACPTSIILLPTGPPLTTGGYICGHIRHCRNFLTCLVSFPEIPWICFINPDVQAFINSVLLSLLSYTRKCWVAH